MIIFIGFAGILGFVPCLWHKLRYERWCRLVSAQLRQALQNMAHALRIGVNFTQALARIAEESEDPLATEWQRVRQAVQVGAPLSQALDELVRRVPIPEMEWFAAAVQITQSSGGSLADVLEMLAEQLQDRQTLREKVGALTAQGKASGAVLGALPFILLIALRLIVPDMVKPMFTTALGQSMLAGVMISVAIGGVVIWKIVQIEVE